MTEIQTQALGEFLLNQSVKAWNMIKFYRDRNDRISETTITEQLIYEIESGIDDHKYPIRLFESRKENVNGNDLEIFINTANGYVLLPCQSKITNREYKYEKFWHTVNESRQISLLCNYAKSFGGIPAYLLYNYIPLEAQSDAFKKITHQERYGITFTEATPFLHVMKGMQLSGTPLKPPTFNSLHPHPAKPLHMVVCDLINQLVNVDSFAINYDLIIILSAKSHRTGIGSAHAAARSALYSLVTGKRNPCFQLLVIRVTRSGRNTGSYWATIRRGTKGVSIVYRKTIAYWSYYIILFLKYNIGSALW